MIVSWIDLENYRVDLIWTDDSGVERRTVVDVDTDIDGATYHYASGDALPDDDGELLNELDHDRAWHRGSEFIPIKARHHRVHLLHRSNP